MIYTYNFDYRHSKNGRIDRENSVWKLFLTLRGIIKKILNEILSDVLDKTIQKIQNSNDLSWKESLSLELGDELEAYKICLQYYHLDKNLELEVIKEGICQTILITLKFFVPILIYMYMCVSLISVEYGFFTFKIF